MAGGQHGGSGERRVLFRGLTIGPEEIARLQAVVDGHPGLTRLELAREACKVFGWRRPNNSFPERACYELLLRLKRMGELNLPPPHRAPPQYRRRRPELPADFLLGPTPGWQQWVKPSATLVVRPILQQERFGSETYMERFHYLGCRPLVGESLRYVACLDRELVALLSWAAAALRNGPRDRYLGWDQKAKTSNLELVVNNARFLILPWVRIRNLASRILAANLSRLSADWQETYGHPVLLAETFVDTSRFRGTCYRASNWLYLGQTRGYSRSSGYTYHLHGTPKAVFVYPLHRRARQLLCAPRQPTGAKSSNKPGGSMVNVEALPFDAEGGLFSVFKSVTDPRMRRGKRHQLENVLAVSVCAVLAGARSFAAIAQWAAEQPREILERLRCRRGKPPSEPTIRRVLRKVDAEEVDQKVGDWFACQESLSGKGIAMDGKTLRGSKDGENKAVHLLSAVVHGTGVVVAQEKVPGKTNEITRVKPLLDGLDIEGAVVTADALLTQKEIARYVTKEKGADYILTVKDNQPTLRQDIKELFDSKQQEAERLHKAKGLDDEAFPP